MVHQTVSALLAVILAFFHFSSFLINVCFSCQFWPSGSKVSSKIISSILGFLSFLGIIVFMIMTSEEVSKDAYYSWGFAMAFTGATIPVLTGVLMCKTHTPALRQPAEPSEPRVVHTLSSTDSSRRTARGASHSRDRRRATWGGVIFNYFFFFNGMLTGLLKMVSLKYILSL